MITADEIAALMKAELDKRGVAPLSQTFVVGMIRAQGGEEFLYKNKRRHWAITPPILEAFRKVTGEDVVWSRGRQQWRRRRETDKPGRMQR